MGMGKLYLLPTPLVEDDVPLSYLPECNAELLVRLNYFIVEQVRTARRFLSRAKLGLSIEQLTFAELNEHTPESALESLLAPLLEGVDGGLMSEAGVPGVADPGANLVALAHRRGIEVVPLIGPSSILLSLMASGMNGQSFCFNGYLPVKQGDKISRLKELEKRAFRFHQTQLFIETPYRNDALVADMLQTLGDHTRLCIASGLTSSHEYIRTRKIAEWKHSSLPSLHKIPTIFIIGE